MNVAGRLLLAVAVPLFFLNGLLCLKCYQCNSYSNENCYDIAVNESSEYLKECGPGYKLCRKQFTVFTKNDVRKITRSCGKLVENRNEQNNQTYYCRHSDVDYLTEHVCECYTDACNKAADLATTASIFFYFAAVLIVGMVAEHQLVRG